MTVDTSVVGSPGWWLSTLSTKLADRQDKVRLLRRYLAGDAPLPEGAEGCREGYRKFQRLSRLNLAELVVSAVQERMVVTGFRTGAEGDENGDSQAHRIWRANDMDVHAADVHGDMLGLADGYVIVGPPDSDDGVPVITVEDPGLVVTAEDPRRRNRTIAALKIFRDDLAELDLAYLYLPGAVLVASRRSGGSTPAGEKFDLNQTLPVSGSGWVWDDDLSRSWPDGFGDVVPVVRYPNRRGVGEFESHLDLLNRVNYGILQRLVVMAMQAFRQRATKGGLPERDTAGNMIDYSSVFRPSPGALWNLPEGVDLWESASADVRMLLEPAKDDIRDLAAVTRTPLSTLLPDGSNQTAEGANFAREGLIFKTNDRLRRASASHAKTMSLAFRMMGDRVRASLPDMEVVWAPAERLTLSERADAASKSREDIPWRSRLSEIWGYSPEAIARMEAERVNDVLLLSSLSPPSSDEPSPIPTVNGDG